MCTIPLPIYLCIKFDLLLQEDNLCLCLAFGIHYLRLAIISWLCVMTYDMLITFRNNVNLNPRPEPVNVLISRFIKYSLFAWGIPSLSVISASIMRVAVNHHTVDNLNPYNCWSVFLNNFKLSISNKIVF